MRSGADALLLGLSSLGLETVFGYPGGAMLPGYDALVQSPLRHVLARHEQGAGHMAEGFARISGGAGVVLATSGPGATNLITPLADAYLDSVPVVAITGQVNTSGLGREAFQEADVIALAAPVTKYSEAVLEPDRIYSAVIEAVEIATAGRPGPVLLDIPKDVLAAPARTDLLPEPSLLSAPSAPGRHEVDAALQELAQARRPVFYVGGGVAAAAASAELRALAESWAVPVVTTLMARSQFPDRHPQHLGMPGMHGHWVATTALQQADLIVAIGARFDDRVTGKLSGFAPHARVVQLDIDQVEIGKNRAVNVPLVGDCREILALLLHATRQQVGGPDRRTLLSDWWATIETWRHDHPLRWSQPADGPLKPQTFLRALDAARPADSIVVTGVGQHQMWAAQHLTHERPGGWITSGGLGTMGFCLPAALGAKAADPSATVVAVDGDASFQMTVQEMATARAENLPIVCVVLNNGGMGMVRQWQDLFYDGRRSAVDLDRDLPSLMHLATAYGWEGLTCNSLDDVSPVIEKALSIGDVPVLLDVHVAEDEMVFPMVAPGTSNDHVIEERADLGGGR
jgi:acetolactate synthase I/II/III large subunit